MSVWTWAWIGWGVYFAVVEGMALFNSKPGDTLSERKPHPMPLLHAAGLLGLAPRHCVYVGDAERDVQAARNAGMIPLVAGFGYLAAGEDPACWAPDAILARPEDLIEWLEPRT